MARRPAHYPPVLERVIEQAEAQLELHADRPIDEGSGCPCEECFRAREFMAELVKLAKEV